MMNAGRELDALVAEKVTGLARRDVRIAGETNALPTWTEYPLKDGQWREVDLKRYGAPPPYSTDIAAAWEIVERFDTTEVKRYYDPELPHEGSPFYWRAMLTKFEPEQFAESGRAATAPLAICLAALRAVGAEIPA